jgi:Raf kinase inhibitor-like YbhB/YbcL family protein
MSAQGLWKRASTVNMAFTLTSPAFVEGETIPPQYSCDGHNLAPPLVWSDPPEDTRGFALIMDDPDAPNGTFTHWVLYDIPATARSLADQSFGTALRNDFGHAAYGGPCPPVGHGPHRYFLTLYAVDVPSLTLKGSTRKALERALQPHTLGTARLIGRYERKSKRSR